MKLFEMFNYTRDVHNIVMHFHIRHQVEWFQYSDLFDKQAT